MGHESDEMAARNPQQFGIILISEIKVDETLPPSKSNSNTHPHTPAH